MPCHDFHEQESLEFEYSNKDGNPLLRKLVQADRKDKQLS